VFHVSNMNRRDWGGINRHSRGGSSSSVLFPWNSSSSNPAPRVRYPAVVSTRHPAKEQPVDPSAALIPMKLENRGWCSGPVGPEFPIELDVAASIGPQVHERDLHVFVPDRPYRAPPGQGEDAPIGCRVHGPLCPPVCEHGQEHAGEGKEGACKKDRRTKENDTE